ncbi:MAG: hypothetical protein JST00_15440 [Deltaproteobacteria bacterium]|nr:hypothetical protein [Deltaproteobacteria bacterium]
MVVLALLLGGTSCRRGAARKGEHIAAGLQSTCTLDASGVPQCWGPTIRVARPPPLGTTFRSLHAAHRIACGVTTERRVVCFGDCGGEGEVTPGTLCDPPRGTFDEVAIGNGGEACALAPPSTIRCWGAMRGSSAAPPSVDGAHGLSVGEGYACVLDGVGRIHCWGDRRPALPAPPTGSGFTMIATARYQACALDAASEIVCWGLGENEPPRGRYVQIAANWEQFCALDEKGVARCWGLVKGYRRRPERHGRDLREIAVGQNHACGLGRVGDVECWGEALAYGEGILPRAGNPLPPPRDDVDAGAHDADAGAHDAEAHDAGIRRRPFHGPARLPDGPPPEDPITVRIDGRPIAIKDAIASTAGEEAVRVVLSTHPLTCAAASRGWGALAKDESRITLTIASLVAEPDGEGGWTAPEPGRLRVSHSSWPHGLEIQAGGVATLPPRAAEVGRSTPLRIAYDASFAVGSDRTSLAVRGATTVRGCGSLPPEGVPTSQPDLEVEVAGRRVPIQGALLVGDAHELVLRLTSGPIACPRGGSYDAPWDYEISLRAGDSKQLTVSGARFFSAHGVVNPKLGFEVLPNARGDDVDVRIDDHDLMKSFPARVRGVAHARRCPPPESARSPR